MVIPSAGASPVSSKAVLLGWANRNRGNCMHCWAPPCSASTPQRDLNTARALPARHGGGASRTTSSCLPKTNLKPQTSNLKLQTNHSGGIQGGISNGEDIYFRVAFKPVATLLMAQQTVDKAGHPVTMNVRGRHDPCVLPRAVPVVEAMAAMTILDALLISRTNRL